MKEKDVKKFDSERIVLDWSAKCIEGYPVYPFTDSTIELLRETLIEHGIERPDDIIKRIRNRPLSYRATISENIENINKVFDSSSSVPDLQYIFREIKDDYGKMLSILYYFDPNSLGTLSEVLLAELIKSVPNVDIEHTGGSNALSDLKINGKDISLKTTAAGSAISLGSHDKLFGKHENKLIVKELTELYNTENQNLTISEIKSTDKLTDNCKDAILRRLQAIREKLSGDDNDHHLVWVEKKYQKDTVLNKINIHIYKMDTAKIENIFEDAEVHLTEKSWGLMKNNMHIVKAGSPGFILNIHPNFLKGSCSEEEIISVDIPIKTDKSKLEIRNTVTDMMLGALKDISETLYPSNANIA